MLVALLFTPTAEATPLVRNSTETTSTAQNATAATPYVVDVLDSKQQRKAAKKAEKRQKRVERMKKRLAKWQSRADDDSKTAAIIAYITIFGFLISLLALHEEGNEYSAFHLRQALGISVVAVALSIIGSVFTLLTLGIGAILVSLLFLVVLIAWIISLVRAIKGSTEPVFLFGNQFQKWFSGIK
ncbi:MAG: hypothetical protein AAGI23_01625 [Bacteroidota bacterium]